ncbi:LPXTG cell wall anchor domain-containing protein [Micromonospora matsumotoense]|uniref:LPXTG cell wall anchor domain-containing protein n=1 Tax=Micromonospora matsumotoense TaxID=121616 RepID=UPI003D8E2BAC
MRKHAIRRLLAGLGAMGVFVAASAAPAPAAPASPDAPADVTAAGFDMFANNITLAPRGPGKTVVLRLSGETPPGRYAATVDFGAVDAFAEVDTPGGGSCTREGTILTCTAFGEDAPALLVLSIRPRADAALGREGRVRFTVTIPGVGTRTYDSTVLIGEGVDLVSGPAVKLSGRPGATVPATLSVDNRGQETVQGAVLLVLGAYGLTPSKRYQNCRYSSVGGPVHFTPNLFACTFDDAIEPGRTFRVGGGFGVTVPGDAWAPNTQTGTATWLTPQDWADVRHQYTLDQQGTGGVLRLEPAGKLRAGTSRTAQTDVQQADNETAIELAVTGEQRADLAADEVRVTGKVGATVPVKIGYTNRGPASSGNGGSGGGANIRLTVPKGVTVVKAPDNCTDADAQQPEEYGQPGARAYECYQYGILHKGERVALPFSFRIDRAGTLTGKVELQHSSGGKDLDPRNDTAKVLVNPGSGGQGGGDGSLPITGSPTGLVAAVGGLLLVAGVGSYLVARRRRARFVA